MVSMAGRVAERVAGRGITFEERVRRGRILLAGGHAPGYEQNRKSNGQFDVGNGGDEEHAGGAGRRSGASGKGSGGGSARAAQAAQAKAARAQAKAEREQARAQARAQRGANETVARMHRGTAEGKAAEKASGRSGRGRGKGKAEAEPTHGVREDVVEQARARMAERDARAEELRTARQWNADGSVNHASGDQAEAYRQAFEEHLAEAHGVKPPTLTPEEREAAGLKPESAEFDGTRREGHIAEWKPINPGAAPDAISLANLYGEHQLGAALERLKESKTGTLEETAQNLGLKPGRSKNETIQRIVTHVTEGRYNAGFLSKSAREDDANDERTLSARSAKEATADAAEHLGVDDAARLGVAMTHAAAERLTSDPEFAARVRDLYAQTGEGGKAAATKGRRGKVRANEQSERARRGQILLLAEARARRAARRPPMRGWRDVDLRGVRVVLDEHGGPGGTSAATLARSPIENMAGHAAQPGTQAGTAQSVDGPQGIDGKPRSWIMFAPLGHFEHPRYGKLNFTRAKLTEMQRHFDQHTRHIDLALDKDHDQGAATGWVERMELRDATDDGQGHAQPAGLYALVRWTPHGQQLLRDEIYRYFSPEFGPWEDPATGQQHENVPMGGALTNRPFLKVLPPVSLSARQNWRQARLNARLNARRGAQDAEEGRVVSLSERGTERNGSRGTSRRTSRQGISQAERARRGALLLLAEQPAVSTRPWSSVDKACLPRSCFLDPGRPGHPSTWRLPIYEGAGPKVAGRYTRRGALNLNAVRAALAALGGARTGKPMVGLPVGTRAKLERLLQRYGTGSTDDE